MAKLKPVFKRRYVQDIYESRFEPSMTESSGVKPLEQILKHRAQGVPVEVFRGEFSDSDYPDFNKMDFSEIANYRDNLDYEIEQLKLEHHASTLALSEYEEKAKKQLSEDKKDEPKQP